MKQTKTQQIKQVYKTPEIKKSSQKFKTCTSENTHSLILCSKGTG
jgi:hypothetical protein